MMTTLPPAPEAVIQLVKLAVRRRDVRPKDANVVNYKANLNYTDLRNCCSSGDICENSHSLNDDHEDEDVAFKSDHSSGY